LLIRINIVLFFTEFADVRTILPKICDKINGVLDPSRFLIRRRQFLPLTKYFKKYLMAFYGSEKEQAYVVVILVSCSYGSIASMINIILIYHMKMTGKLVF
jgi:hypothetical protein